MNIEDTMTTEDLMSANAIVRIASVCHEANRAYCLTIGDDSQVAWPYASDCQRASAIDGVTAILDGRTTSPEQAHETWCAEKTAAGWTFGPVKDPATKKHPCMGPWSGCPLEEKKKDELFFAIVHALKT